MLSIMPARLRGRRQRRPRVLAYEEVFTFSVTNGMVTTISVGTLANRPPRSNFRPIRFEVTARGFVPGTESRAGYEVPIGVQLAFAEGNPDSAVVYVATSQLRLAPATLSLRYPSSADWRSFDLSSSAVVGEIRAVCVGRPGSAEPTAYLRGTARMFIALQPEEIVASCPTLLVDDPPRDTQNSGASSYCAVESYRSA